MACASPPQQGGEHRTLTFLYGTWLPQSGAQLRDVPLYCQRVRFFPDVPANEAVADLFLPIV